jgi:YfiR/HmsC-like
MQDPQQEGQPHRFRQLRPDWMWSGWLCLSGAITNIQEYWESFLAQIPVPRYVTLIPLLTGLAIQLGGLPVAQAQELPEYRLKTAFLYNFSIYTEWPDNSITSEFNLCIYGEDMFGKHLDHLLQKKINGRNIRIQRTDDARNLKDCQIVYISQTTIPNLKNILVELNGKPVLTVADSPGFSQQGIALNMSLEEGKVIFEVNLAAARNAGLNFSSQLLRFANAIYK